MPLKLHQVRLKKAPFKATFSVDGAEGATETVTGFYNPSIYSPKFISEVQGMKAEDPITFARLMAPLIVSWDMVYTKEDEEAGLCTEEQVGKMCPITVEFLSEMPIEFLSSLFSQIRGEAGPDPNLGKTSGGSFSAEEDEGTQETPTAFLEAPVT